MKPKFFVIVFGLVAVFIASAFGQTESSKPEAPSTSLLVDDFNYSGLLVNNGWSAHSGIGTNSPSTTTGLTYAGYPGSGIGNAALIGNAGGEDVNKPISVQQDTNGAVVYYSCLVNVNEAATDKTGDYFIHIGDRIDPTTFTFFAARVFARIVGSNVNFGLSNTSTPTYGTTNFVKNTTYLLIVKYTINTGGIDNTSLWVIPSGVPASEAAAGTPEVTNTATTGQDIIDAIALRQGSSSTQPQTVVDGIRVGTAWSDLVGSPGTPTHAVADFNGDGTTDFAVVRNTGGGASGQLTWFEQFNGPGGFFQANWGLASDTIVSGDFDGDGKADIVIWRPGPALTAGFYILKSSNLTAQFVQFGQTLDDPTVVADYTGDGITDPAIYRAGTKSFFWYKASSGPRIGTEVATQWGQTGDVPVPGDFNGDGKADFVVFRPTSPQAIWYIHPGSGGTDVPTPNSDFVNYYGLSLDNIVPGDYDGDGKADFAVTRVENGLMVWYIESNGSTTVTRTQFGLGTDLEVQGDYDGDGKTDIAVWRPSNGTFFTNRSTSGFQAVQFGASGDTPVLNVTVHGVSRPAGRGF
jgi:FG-GAP-like repeat